MVATTTTTLTTTATMGGRFINNGIDDNKSCCMKCNFQSYIVSSYLHVNCNVCGEYISPGKRVETCSICKTDLCYSCKESSVVASSFIQRVTRNNDTSSPKTVMTTTINNNDNHHHFNNEDNKYDYTSSKDLSNLLILQNHQMCMISCVLGSGNSTNKLPSNVRRGRGGGNNDKKMEMIVDSGASSSVISLNLAKRFKLDRFMCPLRGHVYGIAGQNAAPAAKIVGNITNVPCILGNVRKEFLIDFIVLDDETKNNDELLLLGLDQMRKHKCTIDLESDVVIFGGRHSDIRVQLLPA